MLMSGKSDESSLENQWNCEVKTVDKRHRAEKNERCRVQYEKRYAQSAIGWKFERMEYVDCEQDESASKCDFGSGLILNSGQSKKGVGDNRNSEVRDEHVLDLSFLERLFRGRFRRGKFVLHGDC